MKDNELADRVAALELKVDELLCRLNGTGPGAANDMNAETQRHWWRDDAGRFKDDPVFDEISRLGQAYRESLRPKTKRGKRIVKGLKSTKK